MAKNNTELQLLENYRVALLNIESVSEIKLVLEEYGYDDQKIEEGKSLYKTAREKYDINKEETEKERSSSVHFLNSYKSIIKIYTNHRKIAKVALMEHKNLWGLFKINGIFPSSYLETMEYAKTFYNQTKINTEVNHLLNRFKITSKEIEEQLKNLEEVEQLKAEYEKNKGISQDATQQKNKALADISKWMRIFYSVSKIAFSDRPQLLEVLMKTGKK